VIRPRADAIVEKAGGSHYATVVIAAKRARQISAYYHALSEGTYGEYTPPMVEADQGASNVSIALAELSEDKLKFDYQG